MAKKLIQTLLMLQEAKNHLVKMHVKENESLKADDMEDLLECIKSMTEQDYKSQSLLIEKYCK